MKNHHIIATLFHDKHHLTHIVEADHMPLGRIWSFLVSFFQINKQPEVYVIKNIFPLFRFKIVQQVNSRLFLLMLRLILKRFHRILLVWIYDPHYYWIHNYLRWKYLLFDYAENTNDVDSMIRTMKKNKISFLYAIDQDKEKLTIIKNRNKRNYTEVVWSYISG